jgi:hypothetical protein
MHSEHKLTRFVHQFDSVLVDSLYGLRVRVAVGTAVGVGAVVGVLTGVAVGGGAAGTTLMVTCAVCTLLLQSAVIVYVVVPDGVTTRLPGVDTPPMSLSISAT